MIVAQLRSINEGIQRLEVQMAESGAQLEGHANLVSIKGIGPKAASILLSVIGEVRDFESEDKLASYFGIVPRVSNSNEKVQHGADHQTWLKARTHDAGAMHLGREKVQPLSTAILRAD